MRTIIKSLLVVTIILGAMSLQETVAQSDLSSLLELNACSKMLQQVQPTFKRRYDNIQIDITKKLRETSSNPTLQAKLKKIQAELKPAQNEYGLCILRATSPTNGCITRVGTCITQYSLKLKAFETEL